MSYRIRSFLNGLFACIHRCRTAFRKNNTLRHVEISKYSNFLVAFSTRGLILDKWKEVTQNEKREKVVFSKSSRSRDNFIVEVTKKCAPSVVYIEIKDPNRTLPETGQPITASNGSGFVVREDGWIMTNAHVVLNRPNCLIMVTTSDGATYRAEVKEIDMNTDLALLKIPAVNMTVLKLGDSEDVCVGEWVVALGSPLSLSHTITAGVISSVNRDAMELGISSHPMKYIQTDAAITFGHSGGPLVNLDGEVIGINNLRITAGIAFAIPIEYAKEFLVRSCMNKPGTASALPLSNTFGMTTLTLKNNGIVQLMLQKKIIPSNFEHGVLIWKLLDGRAGHKSGLKTGDIITHVNGQAVHESCDIYKYIPQNGKTNVCVSILRDGRKKEVKIDL